jgi:flagellar basal-body rod protein FlgB
VRNRAPTDWALAKRTEARRGEPTVQILQNLFGPASENYARSLNRLSQRQSVLTGNLANINTPGYKRRDVDFAIELKQAEGGLQGGLLGDGGDEGAMTIEPGEVRVDGNGVDMEREVYEIGENEVRYQAMTQMARGYFKGLRNVIREGR